MRRDSINQIRSFNRRYVPVMRLFDRNYLDTGMSALENAVLIEIGEREGVNARDIAKLLNMDKGYLSRTIRRFESGGLIKRSMSQEDGRVQLLSLTDLGRIRLAELADKGVDIVAKAFGEVDDEKLAEVARAMNFILETLEAQE